MKTKPIIDDRNYSVTCAGVRVGNCTRNEALAKAAALNREWAKLGYTRGRVAKVFYCDRTLVASFPVEEL